MNLSSRISDLARTQPLKTAIRDRDREVSYAGFQAMVLRIAGHLRERGTGDGDVVGLKLKDNDVHLAAMFAIMRIGAAILPLDWKGPRSEFDRIVGQFDPKVILHDGRGSDWSPKAIDISAALEGAPDTEPVARGGSAILAYNLTSGTSGLPRAVVTTHDQMLARCMTRMFEGLFTREDRFLTVLPLAFTAGRETALCLLLAGATVVQFPSLFEPAELIEFVNLHAINALTLSPNMSRALIRQSADPGEMLMPGVDRIISVTGRLETEEREQMQRSIAPRVFSSYGSSGTGAMAVITSDADVNGPTAAGHIAFGIEMEIATEDGVPADPGIVGRVRVRGPAIATQILGGTSNEERFQDGWYYPGDLGRFDERGFLHLAGREIDLIKRGGLMVHAGEVEEALRSHPAVHDAAVVGAESADLGQEIVAFVQTDEPVDAKDLLRHCRTKLVGYKVPARLEIVTDLPRNNAGKVVKARLIGPSADKTASIPTQTGESF